MRVVDRVSFKVGKSRRKRVWVSLLTDGSFVIGCKRQITKKQIARGFNPMDVEINGCHMIARVKYTKDAMGAIFQAVNILWNRDVKRRMEAAHSE